MSYIETFRIYAAGGMSNLSFDEANAWRGVVKEKLENFECKYHVECCNPNEYFNFLEKKHLTEREVKEFDLYKVRHSDLVIVNFNDPKSQGTSKELAVAAEHRIPVIGLNMNKAELHPWDVEDCNRIFTSMMEMLDYVENYYLT